MFIFILKALPVAFAGAYIASFFEKRFKYSLFDTINGVFRKKSVVK